MTRHPGRPGPGVRDGEDVTRYLCAAACLDPGFARDVIDEVVLDPVRAVAPAPGADVGAVARHSLAAVRRSVRRDLLLTVIVVAVAVVAGLPGVLIAVWLCSWALVARAAARLGQGEIKRAASQFAVFAVVSVVCLLGLTLRPADGQLLGAGGLSVELPLQSIQVLVLVIAALWIVVYLDRVGTYGVLAEGLSRETFAAGAAPDPGARWRDRLQYVGAWQGSRLGVYSQTSPAAPFTGFGAVVHTWSASCPIGSANPPARGGGSAAAGDVPGGAQGPHPLDLAELYGSLRAEGESAGFATAELVVVPGWLAPGHPLLDPEQNRPLTDLPEPMLREIADHPRGGVSYHLVWTSFAGPPGAATSLITQLSVRDGVLLLDADLTALPPVNAVHRLAAAQQPAGLLLMFRMLAGALVDVARLTPQAPLNLLRLAAWRWSRRTPGAPGPGGRGPGTAMTAGHSVDHDLGARVGLREIAAQQPGAPAVSDYDATRQANQLSRALVTAVIRSLSELGLDPEPLRRSSEASWQKAMATAPGRGPQVRVP